MLPTLGGARPATRGGTSIESRHQARGGEQRLMNAAHGARIKRAIAGALALACSTLTIGLAGTATATAAESPVWSGAGEVGLPGGAATENQDARLRDVSCSAPGSCAAIGTYQSQDGEEPPMIATETGGVWSGAEAIQLPEGGEDGHLSSISCAPSGPCVAIGDYESESNEREPIAVSREGEEWVATDVTPPSGAEGGSLESISCPAAGACSAVGGYELSGEQLAMAVSETAGQWGAAEEVEPPEHTVGELESVSCASAESCTAVGWFPGKESWQAMREERVAGKWAKVAHPLHLPTESNQLYGGSSLRFHVSCASRGFCAIAGSYYEEPQFVEEEGGPEQSLERAMVASDAGGGWPARAESVDLPENASASEPEAELDSVSCAPSGLCAAVGEYATEGEKEQRWQPLAVSQTTGGAWGGAQQIALPKGEGGYLDSVSCPASGSCVAVGENWTETSGKNTEYEPIVAAQSGGAWGAAQLVPMPAAAATSEPNTWFESVSCPAVGACSAVGIYTNEAEEFLAMAAGSAPALEVSAAGLPSGQVGSPYSAQLTAAGGIGGDSFSLASGSLPAGLTLDAATGVISGAPTAAGSSSFTVKAANAGPPAQSAEAAESIAIAAPANPAAPAKEPPKKEEVKPTPKPLIAVIGSRLAFSHGKLKVRLACKHAACRGAIELTAKLARRGRPSGKASGYALALAHAGARDAKHGGGAKTIALARATYELAAGKSAAIVLRLTAKGQKLLAHLAKSSSAEKAGRSKKSEHAKPLEAMLRVTLEGGKAVSERVKVS
jgi:hypothetical protein